MARKKGGDTPREDVFVLKPLFGIPPPVYLCVLAATLILAGTLWGVVRGITHEYRYLFVSTPSFSTIRVVGRSEEVAPWALRLPSGAHTIEVTHPDYAPLSETLVVERRLLDLFRRTPRVVKFTLQENEKRSIDRQYQEIHSWSLTGAAQQRYQKPPVISNAVESALISYGTEVAARLLALSARDVGDAALLADWIRGGVLITNPHPLLPHGAVEMLRTVGEVLHAHPRTELLVERIMEGVGESAGKNTDRTDESTGKSMGRTTHARLQQSRWRAELVEHYAAMAEEAARRQTADAADATRRGSRVGTSEIRVAGTEMIAIPAGQRIIDDENKDGGARQGEHPLSQLRIVGHDSGLYIAKYEVTGEEFRRFLADNPQWRPGRRDQLMSEGLVDENYLRTLTEFSDPRLPITEVSWHAAAAYCQWLQTQLPSEFSATDYTIRLPTEREWLYAALTTDADAQPALFANDAAAENRYRMYYDRAGDRDRIPRNMLGSVWEWNSNIFHISDSYFQQESDDGLRLGARIIRPLRGGSVATDRERIRSTTEASLYSIATSEFIGFRPVMVPTRQSSASKRP